MRKSSGGLGSPKSELQLHVRARTSLEKLDEAVRWSAEGGWLKRLGVKAGSWDELKRWAIDNWSGVVEAAVRRLGGDVQKELNALRGKLKDDKIAREVVAPALLLIQAEKLGVNEESLRYFAAVISGAIGGDGYVSAAEGKVGLTSGERPIALLWAAALAAHGIKAEVEGAGTAFKVVASGGDAVRLARLYFLFGPPLLEGGDERVINHKLAEAVELGAEGALDIRWEGLRRRTEDGPVTADLTISEGDVAVKFNVYLRNDILLQFISTDRSRVELAARLLRHAGVNAEVKRVGERGEWRVRATTDRLAAGRKELRDAVAGIVEEALARGWVNRETADRWLDKLRGGLTLKEGWPKYEVGLAEGALVVRYHSTNPGNIEREAQRLRAMGLVEGVHFSVRMPEGGKRGYVRILKEGLAYAAWLSVYGKDEEQRSLAAGFVERILQRAKEAGDDVRKKAEEIVEEGKARGSLRLKGFEKEFEVNGVKYKVKVIDGGAVEEDRNGRKLLRIRITAEVGGVRSEYIITYGRRGSDNAAVGYAYIREEADAERFAALVEALTGKRPRMRRRSDGRIDIVCYEGHLEGFARYAELAEAIARWLEETGRR
ncbi:PaRep2b protein [Thermoproteus sp. CP80]|uniref:PaRep2b protein n=1 Tax=Thermoproteus sp. CP80 TaxID=1650659 RepID=UPI00138A51C3|nr:PaRep2b protein [Thermoproteus sp. CP80]